MIIVRIFQGLGNQMFQYAFARALSLRNKKKVKFDVSYYKEYSNHRQYGLDKFNIVESIATEEEIYNVKNGIKKNRLHNFIYQRSKGKPTYYKQPVVNEDLSRFDSNLLKIDSDTYIEGYFTSEVFFKDFELVIKKDLQLKGKPSTENEDLIKKISTENSICISIRRGDFVNNPVFDVCSIDYFQEAITYLNTQISNPVYYIFSDDNEWAKNTLLIKNEHYFITHNYPNFYEDFRIMQNCKHHIIPNSTFSWWAAWLSNHPDKIVVAPKVWLNSTEIDSSYFLPENWVKIQNLF